MGELSGVYDYISRGFPSRLMGTRRKAVAKETRDVNSAGASDQGLDAACPRQLAKPLLIGQ